VSRQAVTEIEISAVPAYSSIQFTYRLKSLVPISSHSQATCFIYLFVYLHTY